MRAVPFSSRSSLNADSFVVKPCDAALRIVECNHSFRLGFVTHRENLILFVGVRVFRFNVTCLKLQQQIFCSKKLKMRKHFHEWVILFNPLDKNSSIHPAYEITVGKIAQSKLTLNLIETPVCISERWTYHQWPGLRFNQNSLSLNGISDVGSCSAHFKSREDFRLTSGSQFPFPVKTSGFTGT